MAFSDFLWGFLAGGAPSIVLLAVLLWWLSRQRRARPRTGTGRPMPREPEAPATAAPPIDVLPPSEPPTPNPPAAPVPRSASPVEPAPPAVPPTGPPVAGSRPVLEADPRPVPDPPTPEPPTPKPAPPPRPRKGSVPADLRIPYRILLHVARQGRVGPNEVPPDTLSQAGMVTALGVRQGAVAAALQRLVAAELLEVERSHVQGGDRRLKVYWLTPRGEELVRDLRRRGRGKR